MPLASLPMYDLPGTQGLWDQVWARLGRELRAMGWPAPERLTRPRDLSAHWRRRDLFLSQSCEAPLLLGLQSHVSRIGRFDYCLPGVPAGNYNSLIVRRVGAGSDLRIAINNTDSQSGCFALQAAGYDVSDALVTGGHLYSLAALRKGLADLAAIDAQSFRLITRQPGTLRGIEVIGRTPPTPGTPLITGPCYDPRLLGPAVALALGRVPRPLLRRLGIYGFRPV